MFRYKYNGTEKIHIPLIGLTVMPGEEFESLEELINSDFELLKGKVEEIVDNTSEASSEDAQKGE